jgi:hypothetical protein
MEPGGLDARDRPFRSRAGYWPLKARPPLGLGGDRSGVGHVLTLDGQIYTGGGES